MTLDHDLERFYNSRYDESERLRAPFNRLELLRTRELLSQALPSPPARVLDVGGGTGVHAAWLAGAGYEVDLVDPVPEHVNQALALAAQLDSPFSARQGDARALDVDDDRWDATLLLGPLYHLPEKEDRRRALREARRVTRAGGLVAVAAICRYAWPLYELRDGLVPRAETARRITATLDTGHGDPRGNLPVAYSHRPEELLEELADAGLEGPVVRGLEGPGWVLFNPALPATALEALIDPALAAARAADQQPVMAAMSAHLLGTARVRAIIGDNHADG